MRHMVVNLMVDTSQIGMTRSEMASSWIVWIGEVMDTRFIIVLVLTGTMIAIVIIHIGGVMGYFPNELKKEKPPTCLFFCILGGTPSPRVRGLEGEVPQKSFVGLEPKVGVLHPSMFGPKPWRILDM